MKRDEKLFSFSKAVAKRIAGKPGEDVIELLFDKDNFNEFKIAEKLKKNINEIRNILYKLSSFNVISSTALLLSPTFTSTPLIPSIKR